MAKSQYGRLWHKTKNGKQELLADYRSFAALQQIKKQKIAQGYRKEELLITY